MNHLLLTVHINKQGLVKCFLLLPILTEQAKAYSSVFAYAVSRKVHSRSGQFWFKVENKSSKDPENLILY